MPPPVSPKSNRATTFELALELHGQGRLEQARDRYLQWLSQSPGHVEALHRLGMVSFQLGLVADAVATFQATVRAAPGRHDVWCNLAAAQLEQGRLDDALASCDRAIAIDPRHAEAWFNRALAQLRQGRPAAAVDSLDRSLAIKPAYAKAWLNRGRALQDLHRLEEALQCLDMALAHGIDDADLHVRRGHVLQELGKPAPAVASYQRALALRADDAVAHNNLGNALRSLGRLEEAVASYRRALAIDPGLEFLPGTLLYTRQRLCDWAGHDEDVRALCEAIALGRQASLPFPVLTLVDSTALQTQAAKTWFEAKHGQAPAPAPFAPRPAGPRIRLGYYSADFHGHATSILMAGLFEAHDRQRFELVAFSFGPDIRDPLRHRVAAAFDHFIDVRALSDQEVAARSRELGIDIAIDLKGYTRHARPGLFAARCAPVQVSYLGYPGSMAVDFIDYLVADRTVLPPAARVHYSEKIVELPGCYQVNDRQRPLDTDDSRRADHGLPEGAFVFCCFNGSHKLTPGWFDVWMRILRAVPGSVLWLLQDHEVASDHLRREALSRGVDPTRLAFAPPLPLSAHLARHRHADLFLDTLPYNAHTTASDALWAGVPLLTCAGESFASRVAASLLQAVQLPQLVTTDAAAYEARAIELATRPGELAALRAHLLAQRMTLPLFDTPAFTRQLEAAYQAMWARRQAGLPPEHIDAAVITEAMARCGPA